MTSHQGEHSYLAKTFGLRGTTALVTGSTRGIGLAIARALASAGANVIVHGRRFSEAESVAASMSRATAVAADLADPLEVARLVDRVLDWDAPLDILVNNAGVEIGARVETMEPNDLHRTLEVNLAAPLALVRGLLPALRRSPAASIINVSSIHETVPSWGNTAYAASKAALAMATKTLAIELGPEGIRVNAIAPGAIATDINALVIKEIGDENFRDWIPLRRVGVPEEIGPAAVFLASTGARYMTGATLVIDGGYAHHLVRYRHSDHS